MHIKFDLFLVTAVPGSGERRAYWFLSGEPTNCQQGASFDGNTVSLVITG